MPPPTGRAGGFGVSYRSLTDDDLPFIAELYASTRRDEIAMTGWPAETQAAFLQHQHRVQHSHYLAHYADAEWLIVEKHGSAIGRLYLHEDSERFHIIDISLVPGKRGSGIGSAILGDLFDQARIAGKAIALHVEKSNRARSLYLRLGFKVIEDRGVYELLEAAP